MDEFKKVINAKIRILQRKVEKESRELNEAANRSFLDTGSLISDRVFEKNRQIHEYWFDYLNVLKTAAMLREEDEASALLLAWSGNVDFNDNNAKLPIKFKTSNSRFKNITKFTI